MPLVLVIRDPERIDNYKMKILSTRLPAIVADHLTCDEPDGKITSKDIEVIVQDYGQFDFHGKDLAIVISAGCYPSRQANLGERRQDIQNDIATILNGRALLPEDRRHGSVWILLISDSSFGEF